MRGKQGYQPLTAAQEASIGAFIDGLVSKPDLANFARIYAGLDLEIMIRVATEDRQVFTPEMCKALTFVISALTGVHKPVVYLEGAPHPEAAEAIAYAANQV